MCHYCQKEATVDHAVTQKWMRYPLQKSVARAVETCTNLYTKMNLTMHTIDSAFLDAVSDTMDMCQRTTAALNGKDVGYQGQIYSHHRTIRLHEVNECFIQGRRAYPLEHWDGGPAKKDWSYQNMCRPYAIK